MIILYETSEIRNLVIFFRDKSIASLKVPNFVEEFLLKYKTDEDVQIYTLVHKNELYNITLYKLTNNLFDLGKAIVDGTKFKELQVYATEDFLGILEGIYFADYNFLNYKTEKKEKKIYISGKKDEKFINLMSAVEFARDLGNEAPNVLYPETYVNLIKKHMNKKVKIKVLNVKEMEALGMNLLLGVGQGSKYPSYSVILEYKGGDEEESVVFLGKGVTFDTGGISLKPAKDMHEMKYDMSGSAAVVSAIHALAENKEKVNVIGLVGLVENAVGSHAQRPGDVLRSMSGKTVEILNTDAEGRLVLADLMTYAIRNYKIKFMMTYGTLTGAVRVCTDGYAAGLFASDEKYLELIKDSGKEVNELLWQLPRGEYFKKQLESKCADLANIGTGYAGSSIAAEFLMSFAEDKSYYHVDMAGVANNKVVMTGYGVKQIYTIAKNACKAK